MPGRGLWFGDFALLAAHAGVMTAISLVACVVRARRTLRMEPVEALFSDG